MNHLFRKLPAINPDLETNNARLAEETSRDNAQQIHVTNIPRTTSSLLAIKKPFHWFLFTTETSNLLYILSRSDISINLC